MKKEFKRLRIALILLLVSLFVSQVTINAIMAYKLYEVKKETEVTLKELDDFIKWRDALSKEDKQKLLESKEYKEFLKECSTASKKLNGLTNKFVEEEIVSTKKQYVIRVSILVLIGILFYRAKKKTP